MISAPDVIVGEQVVADEGVARLLVDEQRVGRAVTGAEDGAQRPAAGADRVAVGEHAVGLVVARCR